MKRSFSLFLLAASSAVLFSGAALAGLECPQIIHCASNQISSCYGWNPSQWTNPTPLTEAPIVGESVLSATYDDSKAHVGTCEYVNRRFSGMVAITSAIHLRPALHQPNTGWVYSTGQEYSCYVKNFTPDHCLFYAYPKN